MLVVQRMLAAPTAVLAVVAHRLLPTEAVKAVCEVPTALPVVAGAVEVRQTRQRRLEVRVQRGRALQVVAPQLSMRFALAAAEAQRPSGQVLQAARLAARVGPDTPRLMGSHMEEVGVALQTLAVLVGRVVAEQERAVVAGAQPPEPQIPVEAAVRVGSIPVVQVGQDLSLFCYRGLGDGTLR